MSIKSGKLMVELVPKKKNEDDPYVKREYKPGNPSRLRVEAKPRPKFFPLFSWKFKKKKKVKCFEKFIRLLKQVYINLPVLQGIPKYVKYVKNIVVNKIRLAKYKIITLTEECNSRILNNTKLKDPRSFIVQVTIGSCLNGREFCDLGASINLMPRSMFKKLGLGDLKPTTIVLQLANHSVNRPDGIVEDVVVQVGSLILPVEFVILDFEPDPEVSFVLEHLFLVTRGALINVAAEHLTMRAHDKVKVFNVYQTLKLLVMYEDSVAITVFDTEVAVYQIETKDPLAKMLLTNTQRKSKEYNF